MDLKLNAAGLAVAQDLLAAETAADVAAAKMARLFATTLEQRIGSGAPIGTGAVLLRQVFRGLTAQVEAREKVLSAHAAAARLAAELGVTGYGDTVGCPPDEMKPSGANVTPLFAAA